MCGGILASNNNNNNTGTYVNGKQAVDYCSIKVH